MGFDPAQGNGGLWDDAELPEPAARWKVRSLALRFTPVYNGKFSEAVDLLKPLLELGPSDVELYTMTLPEWEDFVGTSTQVRGHSAYIRSLVLGPQTLTHDVAEICKFYLGRAPSPDSYIVWTHTGGEIGRLWLRYIVVCASRRRVHLQS